MLRALAHRGPDDEGVYEAPGALLGHRRLSIIDLALGHQPIIDGATGCAMVFNGEIYNYKDLRRELEAQGVAFATTSDTEVLLRLYVRDGVACSADFEACSRSRSGTRERKRYSRRSDHLGQKPLYYHCENGATCCSPPRSRRCSRSTRICAEVCAEALDQYLSLRLIASPLSMFERISKLPPAHYLTFHAGKLHVERYWRLDYEPKQTRSEQEALDELESRLVETLRLHMVSDVPVGAFLSGGMDSGLIVRVARRSTVVKEPLQTFTMGIPLRAATTKRRSRARPRKRSAPSITEEFVEVPSLTAATWRIWSWHLDEPSDPLSRMRLRDIALT